MVFAPARPEESILETSLAHDLMDWSKLLVSTQISEQMEHIIKQRIVKGLFDDVIIETNENYLGTKMREDVDDLPHISLEKPTKNLVELYALEFMGRQAEDRKRANASIRV